VSYDTPIDWLISDTHVGHRNINTYCWRLTPAFSTPEAVDALMLANWHALVQPDDTILHLGDLCKWGKGEPMPELKALPGNKLLLKGNHDLYADEWYEDHGFTIVEPGQMDFKVDEVTVRFTHHPVHTKEILPWEVNVHGHVHNNPHWSSPSHLNVSVELTHFAPLLLDRAISNLIWNHKRKTP